MKRYKQYVEHPIWTLRKQLTAELFAAFSEWSAVGYVVHDKDLKREALSIASLLIGYATFKSENHPFRDKKVVDDEDEVLEKCTLFVAEVQHILENINPKKVFNTDQTAMKLEMRCGRTLAVQGEKKS
ncbi:hypothetical protein QR680_013275 [Steinernema hermaphroditum]|uniref:Uncharacterized protein n=1 Tax=Steinernema hermaphroditum TaxID=289476 RepID=A0AA39I4Y6_9BILA|nr:hypothetical protein QR680_013275 [Steinernema hermaphroditum]